MMEAALEMNPDCIIALDTSTAAMAAAVLRGGVVIGERHSLAERNHSVHIITELKGLMEDAGIERRDVAGFAVGNGPGSYTGMRIAVTAAKTLAWAWSKPLAGVSSLEAIAFGAWRRALEEEGVGGRPGVEHWLLPLMDARRGQVYCAGFACGDDDAQWTRWAEDGVRLMSDWSDQTLARLASRLDGEGAPDRVVVWLTGDLSLHEAAAEQLQRAVADYGAEARLFPRMIEGRYVAELGQKRLLLGESDTVHTFIPNYTQPTEAEAKLEQKRMNGGDSR